MTATRTYRGIPAEQRRAARRRQLLDAGLDAFGTDGYDPTTVKEICRRAGLTERYFYEHFDDRHALLVAVYDDVTATVMAQSFAAAEAAPPDLASRARAGAGAFVAALAEDPRRARVQLIDSVGRTAELTARRSAVMSAFADYLADTAAALYPRPDVAVARRRALASAVVGATNHLVVEWISGALELERDELVETIIALMLAVAAAPEGAS